LTCTLVPFAPWFQLADTRGQNKEEASITSNCDQLRLLLLAKERHRSSFHILRQDISLSKSHRQLHSNSLVQVGFSCRRFGSVRSNEMAPAFCSFISLQLSQRASRRERE